MVKILYIRRDFPMTKNNFTTNFFKARPSQTYAISTDTGSTCRGGWDLPWMDSEN